MSYVIIFQWSGYPVAELELNIQIDGQISPHLDENWLRQVVEKVLLAGGVKTPVELGIVITGDQLVRQLNKQYRGINDTTDVLSFALTEESELETTPFITPPDGVLHLGEVIISHPQMKRQAEEQGHSSRSELALLLAHGVLHLLGHEHDEPHREETMRALEMKVLSELEETE
jgi:probable rRNA maturation factor